MAKTGGAAIPDVQKLFRHAVDLHRSGRFQEAIAAYDCIIALKSNHANAHANRGSALSSLGRHADALISYSRVTAINPKDADGHVSRSDALLKLGRYDEAIAACNRAVAIQPRNGEFYHMRGNILRAAGRHSEALASFDRAIALKPADARAHFSRGNLLNELGRLNEAVASFDRAIALKPDYAPAHGNRSHVLQRSERYEEALASWDLAIANGPNGAQYHQGRACTLCELGRHAEALESFDRAIAIDPNYVAAHVNRAAALRDLERLDEALKGFERALAIAPGDAKAHFGRGSVLGRLGSYAEEMESYDRALDIEPRHANTQLNKGLLQLRLGDWADGYKRYEWRLQTRKINRNFAQPQWRGEPIGDKTILLNAEQGLGDMIQMLRYLPLVKAKAAHVILELPGMIQPLLGQIADGVEVIEPESQLSFDVHCPQISLPFVFETRLDTIPAKIPYLTTPGERRSIWQDRLPKSATPRVGLVWSGNPKHDNDRNRSIALEHLAPLLDTPGISFVSLQRDYRESDLPALACLPIERIDDAIHDFADTAAAIEQCDLVISVDTSVAHLAGSLGRKLWLLLPFVPDWRWLLQRNDSPWYPTARLFRQSRIGDWQGVIDTVINELSLLPNSQPSRVEGANVRAPDS